MKILNKKRRRLKVVCAWCKMVISKGDKGTGTTHGICQCCRHDITRVVERTSTLFKK